MKIKEYRVIHDEEMHPQLEVVKEWDYYGDNFTPDIFNELFHMDKCAEEYLYVIARTYKNEILGVYQLSHGNFKETKADNRELFIFLLLVGAERFEIAHNHPSGYLVKSEGDIKSTQRIREFAYTIGIDFDEHYIISKDGYSQLIHELCENKLILWDGDICEEIIFYVTDSFAQKLNKKILEYQKNENRNLDNCNELDFCGMHYIITDEEFGEIKKMLEDSKEAELCKED